MTWRDIMQHWTWHIDRFQHLFPHADAEALVRFRGNKELLAEYIANTHDLTLREGMDALEHRLMPGADGIEPRVCAAE